MEAEDRVNSPSHYRADGQPECIIILEVLVKRFKKIAALCFGQFKYLYRAGLKKEEGMTIDTKSREDVKKLVWTPGYSHACIPQTLDFSPIKPMNYFLLF